MDNIEKMVCDTILERASAVLVINGHEYPVSSPTPATLILVSELVAQMPIVERNTDNILVEVLRTAKDLSIIGKIAATLILGAKRIKENKLIEVAQREDCRKRWSWRKFRYVTETHKEVTTVREVDYLAELILDNVETATLSKIVSKRLDLLQIGDFFVLTTSLSEANQIKRTKEVEIATGAE